ncbi:MAG: NusA N-terminal domain-containing protein, partial [Pirellulaceae bacterium]|nr:NusA N-terminal domain-containing protein [Pirellulaceae bacterium]
MRVDGNFFCHRPALSRSQKKQAAPSTDEMIMNPNEIIRIVDSLHREKNIDTEIVFQAIEAAFATAARRQYGEESDVVVS